MKWIAIAAVLGLAGAAYFVVRKAPSNEAALKLEPQPLEPEGPSLYDLISAQVGDSPDATLDTEGFPPVHEFETLGVQVAPGLGDQMFGGPADDDGWKTIVAVVHGINDGSVSSWLVADQNLRDISAAGHVDRVLGELYEADLTPQVKAMCWEVAKRSRSYESVKWGIALGGIDLTDEETRPLLVLARHPEFTLYASHVLERESESRPELRGRLLELLPISRQWGVINVINYIARDQKLIAEPAVQRAIVVYGMENNDGIPMEIGFTIASAIDFEIVFAAANGDERLFDAVVDLVGTLIDEPAPLGGLTDLPHQRAIYEGFRELLDGRPTTIATLSGWQSLGRLLSDEGLEWDDREAQRVEVQERLQGLVSEEVVGAGLSSDRHRWVALGLIQEFELKGLLPAVRDAFDESPDAKSIEVLAGLGGDEGRLHLLRAIPSLVDLPARSKIAMREMNSFGPEHRHNFEYARIVAVLGDLGTDEAISALEVAIEDYDPSVRASACAAVDSLPPDRVSKALRASLFLRRSDRSEFVATAAKKAWDSLERGD